MDLNKFKSHPIEDAQCHEIGKELFYFWHVPEPHFLPGPGPGSSLKFMWLGNDHKYNPIITFLMIGPWRGTRVVPIMGT